MQVRAGWWCGFLIAVASAARGQDAGPENFGADQAITIVGHQEFFPDRGDAGYTTDGFGRNAENSQMRAGMNSLPNGAILTNIYFYVRDTDVADDVDVSYCRVVFVAGTGEAKEAACSAIASTSGSDGDQILQLTPNERILYRQDWDSDGVADVVNYILRVKTGNGGNSLYLVRLNWRRDVSPAPASATFGDVPTDHPFFQFIEALADAGITGGCGSGNYCPDAPLTRGQMAAFLAKALGLHWPWNAQEKAGPRPAQIPLLTQEAPNGTF